jgi:hypothetical protein
MKVLVYTDGSTTSNEGIKCALGVLSKEHEYTLLFVLSEKGIYRSYKEIFGEDLTKIERIFGDTDPERAAARYIFLKPLCEYMTDAGFKTNAKVREGNVISEILEEIDEGPHEIVLLSERVTAMRLPADSHLHEIIEDAHKCVLVVRCSPSKL